MELKGKLIQILPLESGQGRNGEWKRQNFIIETGDQYPRKVCITIWGDKLNTSDLAEGKDYVFSIDVESREYNGRWYTDVKAWKFEDADGSSTPRPSAPASSAKTSDAADSPFVDSADDNGDDLPF